MFTIFYIIKKQSILKKLSDYGNYHQSSENYEFGNFKNLKEIQKLLNSAYYTNKNIRVRGMAHSMNGTSLPKSNEQLILTKSINHFRFDQENTITVGAGAAIWDVQTMLADYGYELFVYNDGGATASSVGGYLSAGGIGEKCYLHGGFWETVESILLINGRGEIIKSTYGDGIFKWLFGSMGQLGFIYEVTLKIKPLEKKSPQFPKQKTGKVLASNWQWERQAWYNIFTTKEHAEEARNDIILLSKVHKHAWVNRPIYYYDLVFKRFNPPLIFPIQKDMVALGIWGDTWNNNEFNMFAMKLLEKDFSELILSKKYYRRYVQTELTFDNFNYEQYFGKNIFSEFKKIKEKLDPKGIFGNGIFK